MLGFKPPNIWSRRPCLGSIFSVMLRPNVNPVHPATRALPANYSRYIHPMTRSARIPSSFIVPKWIDPFIHQKESSIWHRLGHRSPGLKRGSVVKIASWNVNWSSPDPESRMSAALEHLEHVFDSGDKNMVLMFQEVCPSALRVMLENPWVQSKFILSDITPPDTPRLVFLNGDSGLEESCREPAPYFTIMMASKDLPVLGCFRIPHITNMGRDILAIDIDTSSDENESRQKTCIRLCTTHLESLWRGRTYRQGQLAVIADVLKRPTMSGYRIQAGIVGGDMNAIDKSENNYNQKDDVNLNDIWADQQTDPFIGVELTDSTSGCTWGHHPPRSGHPARMDKFLYTGAVEPVKVRDSQGTGLRVELLGVGLRTEVQAWELEREEIEFRDGRVQTRLRKEVVSTQRLNTLKNTGFLDSYTVRQKKLDDWVSDHFGIITKIRIL